jgi:hypothetical protein
LFENFSFFFTNSLAKMDMQLLQLFEATTSPDQAIRANAEQLLKQAESIDGFLSTLLPLISQHHASPLATSMAIYCKNKVKAAWTDPSLMFGSKTPNPKLVLIGPGDRVFFKTHFAEVIMSLPAKLAKLLASCLGPVISAELCADGWPELLMGVKACLTSPELARQKSGLLLLWVWDLLLIVFIGNRLCLPIQECRETSADACRCTRDFPTYFGYWNEDFAIR